VFPRRCTSRSPTGVASQLLPQVGRLRATLSGKARAFAGIVKIGRTHLQDATPLTLGQEISGWVAQLDHGLAGDHRRVAGGAPARARRHRVGTGSTRTRRTPCGVAAKLAELTGQPFVTAPTSSPRFAGHDALVGLHGAVKLLATSLMKESPTTCAGWRAAARRRPRRAGHPENEPGSSIMPGKVNPTQCEALTMVCAQVMATTSRSRSARERQLRAQRLQAADRQRALQSIRLVGDACASFDQHCARASSPTAPRSIASCTAASCWSPRSRRTSATTRPPRSPSTPTPPVRCCATPRSRSATSPVRTSIAGCARGHGRAGRSIGPK